MGDTGETWAVVGGGILGLTLAHRLTQLGKRVTLFEAADRLGGLASAWKIGDIVWDRHYHVTLLSDSNTRALLSELDLEQEMLWVPSRSACFSNGQLYSISNAIDLLRFPLLGWIDKVRLGTTILYGSRIRDGKRLEQIPVAQWLSRWSGRRVFERFWLPLLRSKLGEAYEETSAAFIWATIARLYAARRIGLKQEMFGYIPGGYSRVLDRLVQVIQEEGVSIHCDSPVATVQRTGNGIRIQVDAGERHDFDSAVVTTPAPLAERLCPDFSPDERERLLRPRYLGIVCASVVTSEPLGDSYVTNLLDSGLPFTGVIEMSALVDPSHFGDRSLIYLPRYLEPRDPFFDLSDSQVEEVFLRGLERMYPNFNRADVCHFRISRARHVFTLATLKYSDHLPPISTSVPGLYLANSAHIVNATLNVNETLHLAERTLCEISRARA